MNINSVDSQSRINDVASSNNGSVSASSPSASSVQAFNQAMNTQTDGTETRSGGPSNQASGQKNGTNDKLQEMQELIAEILQRLLEILKSMGGSDNGQTGQAEQGQSKGGSTPNGEGGGINPVEGNGPGGSAGSDQLIPPPQEHIQNLNLGGKQVTVGGDGTASAEEVQATASNIQNLYDNSPTFRNMIDTSSDPSFEVSVGRRSDNTSWGNTQGRVFMNINNTAPSNSDTFQSLLAHEFAHASIDLGHGSQMQQVENAVAQEA